MNLAWQKGQSGNPGGRPRAYKEIQELARSHAPEAIATLLDICLRGESESARVMAADKLLERGYGKPVQPHDGDGEGGPIIFQWATAPERPPGE